ncbi:MAG: ribose 5-phosphate isomerase B [Phycisphaeraceae bacterium]|nr:ribose 5-phosphate isomerase B [Phycisphaeraceae bacterium]
MKIAVGADHRATEVVMQVIQSLKAAGHEVEHMGVNCDTSNGNGNSCDYPDQAYPVAKAVADGAVDGGILLCGTGIGMSIAANKVPGIRAALVHDEIGARVCRQHNNANVLCLSADMLGMRIIEQIIDAWINTPFDGGRHARRLAKITAIEQGREPSTVTDADIPA